MKDREPMTGLDYMLRTIKYLNAELEIWHKYYPHQVLFVAEEARAKVEGREPNYPPPIVIG